MKKLFLTLICLTLVLFSCGKPDENTDKPESETSESETSLPLSDLSSAELTEVPDEYLSLDVSNGLDIYVSQFAPNHYSFYLFEHTGSEPDHTELIGAKSLNTDQMRFLLSYYGLGKSDVTIIPWQNPLSSYLSPWMISINGEDTAPKKAEYVKAVEKLLFYQ